MSDSSAGKSMGYQKQVKAAAPSAAPKKTASTDYSSPMAKKWPMLIEAIQEGNESAVQLLIEDGLNVNVVRDDNSPLMLACSLGKKAIAEIILQAGVNVNDKNDEGWNALHRAVHDQSDAAVVELLLDFGINSEAKTADGKTALMLAEEKSQGDIVRLIRRHQQTRQSDSKIWEQFLNSREGALYKKQQQRERVEPYEQYWWLPIVFFGAVGAGAGFLFDRLLQAAAIGLLVGLAAASGFKMWLQQARRVLDAAGPLPEIDIQALRAGRKVSIPARAPESAGASISETPSLRERLAERLNFDGFHLSGPIVVVMGVLATLLLIGGVAWRFRNELTPWYYAKRIAWKGAEVTPAAYLDEVAKNNAEMVAMFDAAGMATVRDDQGQTALIVAADNGHLDIAAQLARQHPELLNLFDTRGNTALMLAARHGNEAVATMLLQSGADVNLVVPGSTRAATALQVALDTDVTATSAGQQKIAELLLQKGANAKLANAAGQTPLHFAARHGDAKAVRLLLEKGADSAAVDKSGTFPLLDASCAGRTDIVRLLIEKGANLNQTASDGMTPLLCACREGKTETIDVLIDAGATLDGKTPTGETVVSFVFARGQIDTIKKILARGAKPDKHYLPEAFTTMKGAEIANHATRVSVDDLLKMLTAAAAQDGYIVQSELAPGGMIKLPMQSSWNTALVAFADKIHAVIVARDKTVYLLPRIKPARKGQHI